MCTHKASKGLCKEFFPKKSEIIMEVGPGLALTFFFGKSPRNSPKPVLIFLEKKFGWGWVDGVSSIQKKLGLLEFF